MAPVSKTVHILCNTRERGYSAKQRCGSPTPCINCIVCAKNCPFNAIRIKDNLTTIDYEKCQNCGLCVLKCPTKAIGDTKKRGKADIDYEKCISCTLCVKKCIINCIVGELNKKHTIDKDKCIGCELCATKCPKLAISINYNEHNCS
jgi:ferredoxin